MSDAYAKHYQQLIGATITSFVGLDETEWAVRPYPILRARLSDKTWVLITICSDPEGNDGGHLEIEPDDEMNEHQERNNKQWQLAVRGMA